jgi:hypothetical protein
MINYSTLPPVGISAPETDPTELHTSGETAEGDPLRQLFHRNANHLNSAQTRRIHARLKHRLFADDSELG